MSAGRRLGAVVALALVLASPAMASCGVPLQDEAELIPIDETPVGLRPPEAGGSPPVDQRELIDLWFVRGDQLALVRRRVIAPVTPLVASDALLAGPTDAERNQSLRSALVDAEAVLDIEIARGQATVSLSSEFSVIPAADQVLAIGQLVLTLTDQRGIGRIRFVVDGASITVPLPNGRSRAGLVSREDYLGLVERDEVPAS
jgi:spore germination protein GerM